MLTHTKVQITAAGCTSFKLAGAFKGQVRLGRWCKVGRTADEPRVAGSNGVMHLARGIPRREAFPVTGEGGELRIPLVGKRALVHALELIGEFGVPTAVGAIKAVPVFSQPPPACTGVRSHVGANAVRHEELCRLRPAIAALGEANFLFPERFTVRGACILLVRGTKSDVTVDYDQGWDAGAGFELRQGLRHPLRVIDIADPFDVPTIGKKSGGNVVAECEIRMSFDRDTVAVVDPAQDPQHLMAGEGPGAICNPSHHVAATTP